MAQFHITDSGTARRCKAKVQDCPLGGDHFNSMAEANEFIEKESLRQYGSINGVTSKKNELDSSSPLSDENLLKGFGLTDAEAEAEEMEELEQKEAVKKARAPKARRIETPNNDGNLMSPEKIQRNRNVGETTIKSTVKDEVQNTTESLVTGLIPSLDEMANSGSTVKEDDHNRTALYLNGLPIELPRATKLSDVKRPTRSDFEQAELQILTNAAEANENYSWEKLMGKKYRTKNSEKEYFQKLRGYEMNRRGSHYVDSLNNWAVNRAESKQYARAYEQGIAIDEKLEARFEEVYKEKLPELKQRKAKFKKLKEDFENGSIKARVIVGQNAINPTAKARDYIAKHTANIDSIFATRGRGDHEYVNESLKRNLNLD